MDRREGKLKEIAERLGVDEKTLAEAIREAIEIEGISLEIPPYFDRFITAKFDRVDERFAELRQWASGEFRRMDGKFAELKEWASGEFQRVDERLAELRQWASGEFQRVDEGLKSLRQDFQNLRRYVEGRLSQFERRFDRVERWMQWMGALVTTSLLGVIGLLIKAFFGGG